nr:uncharacterized protein LOC106685775 [Halyomorpha halys]
MGPNQLLVLIFTLAVYQTEGCQGQWDLTLNSEPLSDNSMVRYKNFTTIGKKEWLSFSWKGGPQEIWNVDLLFFLKREKIEGKINYRKTQDEEVMIPWEIENKEINSIINSKQIFSKPWTLSLCNRLDISFSTDEEGNWEIRIGQFLLHRTSMDNNVVQSRRKRSEDFFEERNTSSYQPPRGLMDDVYDYFFGDEDPATGKTAGIFTRMKTWMRDMACRLGIACEGTNPPPYFPMATVPPPETIRGDSSKNDVFQK